jgi:hypothetical protein
MVIQKRYRYLKSKGNKAQMIGPVVRIQGYWRGLRAALKVMRQDDAAFKIQQSYKAFCWNRRSKKLMWSCVCVQRLWIGAIHRSWMRDCHKAAEFIQKHFRGVLVRTVLGDRAGRELHKKIKNQIKDLLAKKDTMSESSYIAKMGVAMGRFTNQLHNQRVKNIHMRQMQSYSLRSSLRKAADKEKKLKNLGAVQPVRQSVFEPMTTALRRQGQETAAALRVGKSSRVMVQVLAEKKKLDRVMPDEVSKLPHASARRGRAAIHARRIAKRPKVDTKSHAGNETSYPKINDDLFSTWAANQFGGKR